MNAKRKILEKIVRVDQAGEVGAQQIYEGQKLVFKNLKNKKGLNVNGNTNTVYVNPLNSLRFVLNKIRKEKVSLDKDFYVFTGSTVGVVPIKSKGEYIGKVDKLGTVRATIN